MLGNFKAGIVNSPLNSQERRFNAAIERVKPEQFVNGEAAFEAVPKDILHFPRELSSRRLGLRGRKPSRQLRVAATRAPLNTADRMRRIEH